LKEFEYSAPGNPANWNGVLKRPLKPRDDNFFGDNMKYDTPELRKMLAKQVRAFFPKMFSRRPFLNDNVNKTPTEQRLESLMDYVPEMLFTNIMGKYCILRNVDANKNTNGRKMTPDQILAEAEADVTKLKSAVEKYFASTKPVIDNNYGIAGLEYDKKYALKSIPTAKQLADARSKKVNVIKAVEALNPVARTVAKLAIRKNPKVVDENATFTRMVLKRAPETQTYEGYGNFKTSVSKKW
jgi:ribosomal protein L7/L12